MKLLYIFLLSFVVGSRRLSGYYNKGSYIPPDPKPGGYNLCL